MNEELPNTPGSDTPQNIETEALPQSAIPYWLQRLLACNPFYLVSAALLLYGIYRVSGDPTFLKGEVPQLNFNLASLQLYEALLVITAIFLARRKIWYDSTLLFSLENLFVLVPFILISQAALIDARLVWALSIGAGLIAAVRFQALKRFIAQLNFPLGSLIAGMAVLILNVALPIIYRVLHESKFGTRPDWGPAYHTNQYMWLLGLPLLCALANIVPPQGRAGLRPASAWFAPGLFLLWLAATGVHLYCLGYVYDFALQPVLVAPALWVLTWTLRRHLTELVPALTATHRHILLFPPLVATLLAAAQPSKAVFLTLTVLNAFIYRAIYARNREQTLALHLGLISLLAIIAGFPEEWGRHMFQEFNRAKCIAASIAGYVLIMLAFSRNPKLAIVGAFTAGYGTMLVFGMQTRVLHWAVEIGLALLLSHSLRWRDEEHDGARACRIAAAALWVLHAVSWMNSSGAPWMSCAVALPVLVIYLVARALSGNWGPITVPIAAVLVMLSGPGEFTVTTVQSRPIPIGPLAVLGSFVLFGLGTIAALRRRRSH